MFRRQPISKLWRRVWTSTVMVPTLTWPYRASFSKGNTRLTVQVSRSSAQDQN